MLFHRLLQTFTRVLEAKPGPRFVFVTCILFAFASFSGLFINRAVAPARVAIAVIPVLIMLNLEILSGSGVMSAMVSHG